MIIDEGLYSYLTGVTAVSTLISTRLYPLEMPQNVTLPAACYQLISDPMAPGYTHQGPTNLLMPRFQIDCYAATSLAAAQLARAVRVALDGYVGSMGSLTVAVAQVVAGRAAYEDEPRRFRCSIDVQIQYYI
jgi:hypothetical protein